MDLKAFCAEEDFRYTLSRIMAHKGFAYAMDGRIVVRVPAPSMVAAADDVFPKLDAPDQFAHDFSLCVTPFPAHGGETWQSYDECDCRGPDPHPDCALCEGTGDYPRDFLKDMLVGKKILAGKYIVRMNLNLSNVRYHDDGRAEEPLVFIADGGLQGVVAAMRSSDHLVGS